MRPFALSLLFLVLLPALAHAAGDEAKQHFDAAIALVQKHDFQAAIAEFEACYRLNPLPEVRLDIALCQRSLGRPAEAIDELQRYIDEPTPQGRELNGPQKAEAKKLLAEVETEVATLQVSTSTAARLSVDGKPASALMKLDPGTHHVEASAVGFRAAHADVVAIAGKTTTVELTLVPEPKPPIQPIAVAPVAPSAPVAPVAIENAPRFVDTAQGRAAIGVGAGAAALFIAGAVTGGLVLDDKDQYRTTCLQSCDGDLYGRAHTLAVTTDVLFSVGGVAAVTSLVLVLARPKHHVAPVALVPQGELR